VNAGRILVVEDQATWQRELSKLLRAVSVQVDVVSDAAQAWLSVQSHEYELIIIDLSLVARVQHESVVPNKEGAALLARVRKSEGGDRIAVAIITGYPTAPAEIRDAFTEYDVDDFIEKKPWDPERFVARVRRAVVRARIRSARHASLRRQRATIIATPTRIISCELWGPQRGSFVLDPGVPLSTSDLGSRVSTRWFLRTDRSGVETRAN
jgi:DNA-binding response OmpR family regulator